MSMSRIYLDNAATSWPKPESVYAAVDHYQRHLGAAAGRGVYREAIEVGRLVDQTRLALCELIAADDPRNVILTYSGTDSLMLALHGVLRAGDHAITSVCDHNSVLRPLRHLEQTASLAVTRIGADPRGVVDLDDLAQAFRPNTRLVALTHASNVTGAIQPVEQVSQLTRAHGAMLLVDAAQTVGHLPVSITQLGCDMLASPGHKGLMGPTGTGFLYIAPNIIDQVAPVRLGGTGTQSESDEQPEDPPARYEAGNLNVPGIVGLRAGVQFVQQRDPAVIARHEANLTQRLCEGLAGLSGVQLYGPRHAEARVGVVSLNLHGHEPQELAVLLDQMASIQTRAGFHCAARMHEALKTTALGGTLRVSCGPFNTTDEIDQTIQVLAELSVS